MKAPKLVLAGIAVFMSLAAFSQTDTTTKKDTDTTTAPQTDTTTKKDSTNLNLQGSSAAVTTMPAANFGRYYIPVLGEYKSSATGSENQAVTISGDESNAGKVWVEGLNGVKFYALLKTVPGTYKIPTQKQDDKTIHEGTLIYDEAAKQVSICLGCGYNQSSDASTSEVAKHKNAKEVVEFTGTKTEQATAQK